jgi:hypothetical protein
VEHHKDLYIHYSKCSNWCLFCYTSRYSAICCGAQHNVAQLMVAHAMWILSWKVAWSPENTNQQICHVLVRRETLCISWRAPSNWPPSSCSVTSVAVWWVVVTYWRPHWALTCSGPRILPLFIFQRFSCTLCQWFDDFFFVWVVVWSKKAYEMATACSKPLTTEF